MKLTTFSLVHRLATLSERTITLSCLLYFFVKISSQNKDNIAENIDVTPKNIVSRKHKCGSKSPFVPFFIANSIERTQTVSVVYTLRFLMFRNSNRLE